MEKSILLLIAIGFSGGILSGMFGIGGGVILVPAMVFFLGYTQKMAQGTSLFMLMLPVAAASVWTYYKAGNLDVKTALFLAVGFVAGGYLGGMFANKMPETLQLTETFIVEQPIKKLFGVLMIVMAFKLLLGK